ncbi:MAG: rod shape-determining protein MreC [Alistipes sp.]|nr:rod shape-determining protein MreC [Candidatus Alistipes equi]
MEKLILFFKQSYLAIISIVVEIIAIYCYVNSSAYAEARFQDMSQKTFGRLGVAMGEIGNFISLGKENRRLTERIVQLENKVEELKILQTNIQGTLPPLQTPSNAVCLSARIVSNSTNKPNNFITINKGYSDGVAINDAILSAEGYAVGSIVLCSEHYCIAKSILSTSLKISGQLKSNGNIGSIHWMGGDIHIVDFTDIDKYAEINIGDEVVAAGFSHYFPDGTTIGYIEEIVKNEKKTSQHCKVRLCANLSTLRNVIIYKQDGIMEAVDLEMNLEKNVQ